MRDRYSPSLNNITQISSRSHTDLSDIGTNTHDQIDTHLALTNEHINHASVSITAGTLLTGGGTIAASRTLNVDEASIDHGSIDGLTDDDHTQYPDLLGTRSFDVIIVDSSDAILTETFTGSATGWTLETGWAYNDNNIKWDDGGNEEEFIAYRSISVVSGVTYLVTFDVSGFVDTDGSTLNVKLGGTQVVTVTANGAYSNSVVCGSSNTKIEFVSTESAVGGTDTWTIDNVTVTIRVAAKIGDGGTTNYLEIRDNGDINFFGTGGFYPRRISQAAQPANGTGDTQIDVGELLVWRDTDDSKTWLVYNDTDEGVRKVEMT